MRRLVEFVFGRAPVEERSHPLFGRMWFWRYDDGSYWETEPEVEGRRLGVIVRAEREGPSPEQEAFFRGAIGDPDALFELARPVLQPEYERWTGRAFPVAWRDAFTLAGMELPEGGDAGRPWSVSYDDGVTGHHFTAYLEGGLARRVEVDG